jgi:urease accessory protein UreF
VKIAETPIVSEVVAAALMAAAASLASPAKTRKAAAAAADGAAQAGTEALKLGDSLRRIAIDVARRTLDAWEETEASRGGRK